MPKTIKLTKKQTSLIKNAASWTPYWFETSHGIVSIPGAPDEDDVPPGNVWYDDSYECGCCPCCGCDCYMNDEEDAMEIEYVDLESNGSATLYIDEGEDE